MLLELTRMWNTAKPFSFSSLFIHFFFLYLTDTIKRKNIFCFQPRLLYTNTLFYSIYNCSNTIIFCDKIENITRFHLKIWIHTYRTLHSFFSREVSMRCKKANNIKMSTNVNVLKQRIAKYILKCSFATVSLLELI